jgi:glyoxylase-like metal-dependent hydrolase (beta-lactamase superfamily II)
MRLLTAALLLPLLDLPAQQSRPLQIEQFVADSTAFHVNAVLLLGPTEAILVDGQYYLPDAVRVADRIAASGRKLKAIFLTHPDHDHFAGIAAIVERFPGTPVYMTRAGLESYRVTAQRDFQQDKSRRPTTFPDSIVTPQELPSLQLTIDGIPIEILPDLQGDVLAPLNSVVWIPSLRTVIASDVVFNGVHPWLAVSTPESRQAWRGSLERIRSLRPTTVIAGHKPAASASDDPAVLDAMERYLTDFDATRLASADMTAMVAAMRAKYADWKVTMLLRASANRTFNQGRSAGGAP